MRRRRTTMKNKQMIINSERLKRVVNDILKNISEEDKIKYRLDRDAINFKKLECFDVARMFNVYIYEASPEAYNLHYFVISKLLEMGYDINKIEVITEW